MAEIFWGDCRIATKRRDGNRQLRQAYAGDFDTKLRHVPALPRSRPRQPAHFGGDGAAWPQREFGVSGVRWSLAFRNSRTHRSLAEDNLQCYTLESPPGQTVRHPSQGRALFATFRHRWIQRVFRRERGQTTCQQRVVQARMPLRSTKWLLCPAHFNPKCSAATVESASHASK